MFHHHPIVAAAVATLVAVPFWLIVLEWWPWDWRGKRREIKLNTRHNDWDD